MDPQEGTVLHPVIEFCASKEPGGCSLGLGLATNVIICRWVRRRKPFEDVLFYLCPWRRFSPGSGRERVRDHEHFTSSTSHLTPPTSRLTSTTSRLTSTTSHLTSSTLANTCRIVILASSEPEWTSVQCGVGEWTMGTHTSFGLSGGLQNLRYRHLDFLIYQAVESLESVLNIRPPQ
jgi:hypothetical protein